MSYSLRNCNRVVGNEEALLLRRIFFPNLAKRIIHQLSEQFLTDSSGVYLTSKHITDLMRLKTLHAFFFLIVIKRLLISTAIYSKQHLAFNHAPRGANIITVLYFLTLYLPQHKHLLALDELSHTTFPSTGNLPTLAQIASSKCLFECSFLFVQC